MRALGRRCLLLFAAALAAVSLTAVPASAAPPSAAPASFQSIGVQRIDLPAGVTSAGWPVFAHDGRHLLFYSTSYNTPGGSTGTGATAELWIVGLDGSSPHCLTCGVPGTPTSQGEGETAPFPDGKRIFFGSFFQPGHSQYAVLTCTPSVVDCRTKKVEQIDFSAAEPPLVLPGGVALLPQVNTGGAYGAKISQDGKSIGFSDLRTDSVEAMVVGRLTHTPFGYRVTSPKVINPPAPTSAGDRDVTRWSEGGALYEFKTFTNGGADATYVEVGGPALQNPDVWSVNLKTGKRVRLTGNADYDEDNAVSPDGRALAVWSNRTMHMTDWLGGQFPVRDFIDAPAALLGLGISSSNKRCHGPMWLLPSDGDRGGRLVGQPIVYDDVPHVFVTNNLTGWSQWSPDSTMLALNTTNNTAGKGYPAHAPFLLVAHLDGTRPTQPLAPVSAEPGSWAIAPQDYHPDFGFDGDVTLNGPGGGTVTLTYRGIGLAVGQWSEVYDRYSEDGQSFVSGSVKISSAVETGTYAQDLTMTGQHTGRQQSSLTFAPNGVTGSGTSTYDGHTVTGPSKEQAAEGECAAIQPKQPQLRATVTVAGATRFRVHVAVAMRDAGANQAGVEVEPVRQAVVTVSGRRVSTDAAGNAVVTGRPGERAAVTAGNTLVPTSVVLRS